MYSSVIVMFTVFSPIETNLNTSLKQLDDTVQWLPLKYKQSEVHKLGNAVAEESGSHCLLKEMIGSGSIGFDLPHLFVEQNPLYKTNPWLSSQAEQMARSPDCEQLRHPSLQ